MLVLIMRAGFDEDSRPQATSEVNLPGRSGPASSNNTPIKIGSSRVASTILYHKDRASPRRIVLFGLRRCFGRKRPRGGSGVVDGDVARVYPAGGSEGGKMLTHQHKSMRFVHPERQQPSVKRLNRIGTERQDEAASRNHRNCRLVLFSGLAVCLYLCAGVLLGTLLESWSVSDSLYFSIVTLTTVGYGDLHPTTYAGRIYCAIYIIIGVAMITVALGIVGEYVMDKLDGDEEAYRNFDPKKFWAGARCKLLFSFASISLVVVVGVVFFIFAPPGSFKLLASNSTSGSPYGNENFADALYFVVVTIGTVGYGDVTPGKYYVTSYDAIYNAYPENSYS